MSVYPRFDAPTSTAPQRQIEDMRVSLRRLVRALELRDQDALVRGEDIEVAGGRVILTSANGTRYALVVSDAGALSTEVVT